MAKKKYRISKPNLMGGSVSSDSKQIQNMALGGNAVGNNEQIQAIMKTIYDLFKQGMTKMDIENSLLGQGMPYE
jgi:archaellum component FlaC